MQQTSDNLLEDIEAFLAETRMGASYFGKRATGNSELVPRLRERRRVWPETAEKARSFMRSYRLNVLNGGHDDDAGAAQPSPAKKPASSAQVTEGGA